MALYAYTRRCNLILRSIDCGNLVLGWEWQAIEPTSDAWKCKISRESFAEPIHAIAWALLHGLTVTQHLTAIYH